MKYILSLSLLLAGHAHGATQVDWFTLDGGGGVQVSADYTANFTVGQNDVEGEPVNLRRATRMARKEEAEPKEMFHGSGS